LNILIAIIAIMDAEDIRQKVLDKIDFLGWTFLHDILPPPMDHQGYVVYCNHGRYNCLYSWEILDYRIKCKLISHTFIKCEVVFVN
jgi:hypothetical protein